MDWHLLWLRFSSCFFHSGPPRMEENQSQSKCQSNFIKFMKYFQVGGLVGTQRKKSEHVLFKSHFERRTSSTKRLHTTSAKSGSEDHTTLFRAFDSVALSQVIRPKMDEKLVRNRRKSTPDRAKIDEKSILSCPWAPKIVLGTPPDAFGTAFGHANDDPRPI